MPKLADLLDVEKIKQIVSKYYEKKIKKDIENGIESHYPIMKAMTIVKAYQIFALVIIIFGCSYFTGIFFHIFCFDIENWQHPYKFDVF